ncbi:MAG: uroporphyrinogen decarboxylase family protein [Mesotoga sp.]|uniref:uroporphyrinogen decarboxylase family protein n=1 Tax=Mesotoga sp. TaxID=2053577 RepID=UPI00262F832E|nr:uroporphyrinogen decarboxylase family protein [Mesotoga sp.]MDD4826414.1 uroporphyrinogen decarboxylase family protein [Mesotoga sp.]
MVFNRSIIPLLGAPGARLTETTLKENLTNAEIQFSSLAKLMDEFQPDGIFFMMDLTVEAEALGLEIGFPEDDNPYVKEHPIKGPDELSSVVNSWRGVSGRMGVFAEVADRMARELPVKRGSYVIGPLSLAGELVGVTDLCMKLIEDPAFAESVIDFCSRVVSEYSRALIDHGADMIAVLEPTAVLLSKRQFKRFVLPYFERLRSDLSKPLIYHICGDTEHIVEPMGASGAYGLSLDSMVDVRAAAERVPEDVFLIGNIDPVKVFLQSNEEEVERETAILLEKMKDVPNFILSSGCDIPLETPPENISAFFRAGRNYRS